MGLDRAAVWAALVSQADQVEAGAASSCRAVPDTMSSARSTPQAHSSRCSHDATDVDNPTADSRIASRCHPWLPSRRVFPAAGGRFSRPAPPPGQGRSRWRRSDHPWVLMSPRRPRGSRRRRARGRAGAPGRPRTLTATTGRSRPPDPSGLDLLLLRPGGCAVGTIQVRSLDQPDETRRSRTAPSRW